MPVNDNSRNKSHASFTVQPMAADMRSGPLPSLFSSRNFSNARLRSSMFVLLLVRSAYTALSISSVRFFAFLVGVQMPRTMRSISSYMVRSGMMLSPWSISVSTLSHLRLFQYRRLLPFSCTRYVSMP